MEQYAIITENDISDWDDDTGVKYHYPKTYRNYLLPGTKVIYYKGRMIDRSFVMSRLSPEPHYFGTAIMGEMYPDTNSSKGDLFSDVINYQPFVDPIPIKINGKYLESIPESRRVNYWMFGVRKIDKETYERILTVNSIVKNYTVHRKVYDAELESIITEEGGKKSYYTTRYERKPECRKKAIAIHGLNCMACGFNFKAVYGDHGKDYIHVHHVKPLHTTGRQIINPETDLIVVCPNCHSMIHREKNNILSLKQLTELIKK